MPQSPTRVPHRAVQTVSLLTGLLMTTATAAPAQTAECGTVKVSASRINTYFMQYRTDATFPEEPKRYQVDFLPGMPKPTLTACDVSVSYDGNMLEVRAGTLDRLRKTWDGTGAFLFVPESQDTLQTFLHIDPQARTIGDEFFTGNMVDDQTVMAVRIDNGTLQKLLYKGVLTGVTYPETARVINIYIQNATPGRVTVARLQLDLSKTILTTWYKSEFPKK